jgi:hypothetical protein
VLLDDVIPSRLALGFNKHTMDMWFLALDPERLGQNSIECKDEEGNLFGHDFGDNAVNWKVKSNADDAHSDDDEDEDMDHAGRVNKALGKVLSNTTVNFLKCKELFA